MSDSSRVPAPGDGAPDPLRVRIAGEAAWASACEEGWRGGPPPLPDDTPESVFWRQVRAIVSALDRAAAVPPAAAQPPAEYATKDETWAHLRSRPFRETPPAVYPPAAQPLDVDVARFGDTPNGELAEDLLAARQHTPTALHWMLNLAAHRLAAAQPGDRERPPETWYGIAVEAAEPYLHGVGMDLGRAMDAVVEALWRAATPDKGEEGE